MYVPRDTTPDAWSVQIEIWSRMTPEQRSLLAAELSENVRRTALEGIRSRHPEFTDDEALLALFEQIHGKEVVDRVWRSRVTETR